jgi:hypothetical protein
VIDFQLAPDSARVVYLADQEQDEVFELYGVSLFPQGSQLTALGPAKVWLGLGGPGFGIKFGLKAEVYVDAALAASGAVDGASGGFGANPRFAKLISIPLALTAGPVTVQEGSQLEIRVLVRNACSGSWRTSGTARLWFNGKLVDSGFKHDTASRFGVTIAGASTDYFLRGGFALDTSAGSAKQSVDAGVGAKCGPFVPFGTWSITLP